MIFPKSEDLQQLRKGLRKRNPPKIFSGLWCSQPGIGGMRVVAAEEDFTIEWVYFEHGARSEMKRASWKELCNDPVLESERLQIGCVVSEIYKIQGAGIRDSIGHPVAAMQQAKPYFDDADSWRHWGLVKAGHMLGV